MYSTSVISLPESVPLYELGLPPGSQIELHFQPKANAFSGQICGAEVLVRGRSPDGALIYPDDFIPVIEMNKRMPLIGTLILRQACSLAAQINRTSSHELRIAVNVSQSQLADPQFPSIVRSALSGSGLSARLLELEVTESMLAQDLVLLRSSLANLRSLGIRTLIDDFGTGYSSLLMLQNAPIDGLKIDKSFMLRSIVDPTSFQIVKAIAKMAEGFELHVVAEGVENPELLDVARSVGVDEIQGWVYSKALPFPDFVKFIERPTPLPARSDGSKRLILIVDDEPNILNSLRRVLRIEGCEVICKTSAQEALETLSTRRPDLIITDQRMPGMCGSEFLRQARLISPDSLRVILSGYSEVDSIVSAINDGSAWKFLSKPWDDAQLREVVFEAFKQRKIVEEHQLFKDSLAESKRLLEEANANLTRLLGEKSRHSDNLHAALHHARMCFEKTPAPLVGVDSDGMIVAANLLARERLGAPLVGMPAETVGYDEAASAWALPEGPVLPCEPIPLEAASGTLVHILPPSPHSS